MLRSAVCIVQYQTKNRKYMTKNLCFFQQVEYVLVWPPELIGKVQKCSQDPIPNPLERKLYLYSLPLEIYLFQTPCRPLEISMRLTLCGGYKYFLKPHILKKQSLKNLAKILVNKICISRKNPYPTKRRDVFRDPQTLWKYQLSFIHFFKCFGLREPPSPRKFQSLLQGGGYIDTCTYFLKLHNIRQLRIDIGKDPSRFQKTLDKVFDQNL